ncbi:Ca(2+)-dependent cysteine protease [Tulasnella sp. 418]|nr:Ca(2+)-dependent cysteine protease [Tulasnella sp. 418]
MPHSNPPTPSPHLPNISLSVPGRSGCVDTLNVAPYIAYYAPSILSFDSTQSELPSSHAFGPPSPTSDRNTDGKRDYCSLSHSDSQEEPYRFSLPPDVPPPPMLMLPNQQYGADNSPRLPQTMGLQPVQNHNREFSSPLYGQVTYPPEYTNNSSSAKHPYSHRPLPSPPSRSPEVSIALTRYTSSPAFPQPIYPPSDQVFLQTTSSTAPSLAVIRPPLSERGNSDNIQPERSNLFDPRWHEDDGPSITNPLTGISPVYPMKLIVIVITKTAHMPPLPPVSSSTSPQTQASHRNQYSQCNGRKRGLFIGINYLAAPRAQLEGCINDAKKMRDFVITRFDYNEEDTLLLTDDTRDPRNYPSKANIIRAMLWLVQDARSNDSLFFHFSGHGGFVKDKDGDEEDGYDEAIYPADYKKAGIIIDDYLHSILVQRLPMECRLTAVFDSCHSGTVLDLPYIYSTQGIIKRTRAIVDTASRIREAVGASVQGDLGGVIRGINGVLKNTTGGNYRAGKYARMMKSHPANAISWTACRDHERDADTRVAGQITGAMSFAFMSALGMSFDSKPKQTYYELLMSIRGILENKLPQKPQLSSSHPIDVNMVFIP